MTTIAYHQYCNISYIGGSYVCYPIDPKCGPSTLYGKPLYHIRPNSMRPTPQGVLYGFHPNPQQFQSGDASSSFSQLRLQYKSTNQKENQKEEVPIKKKSFNQLPYSMYLRQQKAKNVGQSSLSVSGPLTYKCFDKNNTRTALQKVRNASCVAPAKKGNLFK